MKDKEKKPPEAEVPPEQEAAQAQEPQPEQPLEDELEKLRTELAAQKEQYLRVLAEYDNFRKRTAGEKTAIYNNAVADTVQAILPIADNISLALGQENASGEDMRKGVEMIGKNLQDVLAKLGVTAIGEVGDPFDPEIHQAVSHVEDDALGENVISMVYRKGYRIGDRIVRHATVVVAN